MTDRKIEDLHPLLEPLAREFLVWCEHDGLKVIITETFRSPEREDQLHAQGITRATSKTCKHCFMLNGQPASKAFDFAVLDSDSRVVTDGTDGRYSHCGEIIEKLGMIWGGNFTTVKDFDHCEIP